MPTAPLSDSGGVELAENIFAILGGDFQLPDIDLNDPLYDLPPASGAFYGAINKLENTDLTTGEPGGAGTFDILMKSIKAHLKEEYDRNRITGADYSTTYIALTQAALSGSIQYLLGKDQAYWQALLTQVQARRAEIEAITARVQLGIAKAQLQATFYTAQKSEADYALSKMQLATADAQFEMLGAQKEQVEYQTNEIFPAQKAGIISENSSKDYTRLNILPAQKILIEEQGEVQRAQTLDTRSDGAAVRGSTGKQKDLYDQQIDSYVKDAQYKVSKMYLDAWVTQKTLIEETLPPDELKNDQINSVLKEMRQNHDLGPTA